MTLTRVIIPTTEGLAEIQSLTEELPDIESAMFVDGGYEESDVSENYRKFVGRQRGVIERESDHASYRLDVSARIDSGDSWQLAVYLAHRLLMRGELAGYGEASDRTIVATGEVRLRGGEISVERVDHVARKIRQIAAAFERKSVEPLFLVLANENANEVTDEERALLPVGSKIIFVPAGVAGRPVLENLLGPAAPPVAVETVTAPVPLDEPAIVKIDDGAVSRRRKSGVVLYVAVAVIGAAAGAYALSLSGTAVGEKIAGVMQTLGITARPSEGVQNRAVPVMPDTPSAQVPDKPESAIIAKPGPQPSDAATAADTSIIVGISYEVVMAPLSLSGCSALRFQPEKEIVRHYNGGPDGSVAVDNAENVCRVRATLSLAKTDAPVFIGYRVEFADSAGKNKLVRIEGPMATAGRSSFAVEVTTVRSQEKSRQLSIIWLEAPGASAIKGLVPALKDSAIRLAELTEKTKATPGVAVRQTMLTFER